MTRRSITERYERQIDRESAELAGLAPANLSAVHVKTVDVLTSFMEVGERLSTTGDTPTTVRALMTMLRRCRPMLLEQLGNVPPDAIKEFVADIRAQLGTILETDDEGAESSDGDGAARRLA